MTLKGAWQLKRSMNEEYPTQSATDSDTLAPPLPGSAKESSDEPLLSVPAENLDEALDFLTRKALQIRVWPPVNASHGHFPCTAGCPINFRLKITHDIHHLRHRTDGILPTTSGQRIVCPECDHQAEDWPALIDHVDAEHYSLSDEQPEKMQKKANEKTKRYRGTDRACRTCKMQFATCAVQQVHALQHRADFGTFDKETAEVQQCPLCTFSTGNVRTLVEHVDNCHARKDLHVCPRCQRSFVTFQRLERHIQQIHLLDDAEKPYECPTCHRKFTGNTYYVRHMRTHHGNTVKCLYARRHFPPPYHCTIISSSRTRWTGCCCARCVIKNSRPPANTASETSGTICAACTAISASSRATSAGKSSSRSMECRNTGNSCTRRLGIWSVNAGRVSSLVAIY
ncbi:zinc finger protein 14-like isoform X1 [Paramacrobiotus metropolitanus]|uniref:zinc finger protein 14-like isoform X1 n=1 Tax=Paramacrobiotus metropolitanus TaxID=2943436 RepID=UPI002445E291|nr:zinc finger protein 14-like isoform X1 [Paramacrobiotus metropolitanus]